MKIEGDALALRIYIGDSDTWHGHPLHLAIIIKAKEMGLAGATAFKGIEGFGANSRIHTASILRLSEDLPMVVEIVDRRDRIETFLPVLDEMIREGMITLHEMHVVKYTAAKTTD